MSSNSKNVNASADKGKQKSLSYATLGSYNTKNGFQGARPPVPLTTASGFYSVPTFSPPSYDTLVSDPPSFNKYFTIGDAYRCSTSFETTSKSKIPYTSMSNSGGEVGVDNYYPIDRAYGCPLTTSNQIPYSSFSAMSDGDTNSGNYVISQCPR